MLKLAEQPQLRRTAMLTATIAPTMRQPDIARLMGASIGQRQDVVEASFSPLYGSAAHPAYPLVPSPNVSEIDTSNKSGMETSSPPMAVLSCEFTVFVAMRRHIDAVLGVTFLAVERMVNTMCSPAFVAMPDVIPTAIRQVAFISRSVISTVVGQSLVTMGRVIGARVCTTFSGVRGIIGAIESPQLLPVRVLIGSVVSASLCAVRLMVCTRIDALTGPHSLGMRGDIGVLACSVLILVACLIGPLIAGITHALAIVTGYQRYTASATVAGCKMTMHRQFTPSGVTSGAVSAAPGHFYVSQLYQICRCEVEFS